MNECNCSQQNEQCLSFFSFVLFFFYNTQHFSVSPQNHRDLKAVFPPTSIQSDVRVNPRLSLGQVKSTVHFLYQGLPGSRKLTGQDVKPANYSTGSQGKNRESSCTGRCPDEGLCNSQWGEITSSSSMKTCWRMVRPLLCWLPTGLVFKTPTQELSLHKVCTCSFPFFSILYIHCPLNSAPLSENCCCPSSGRVDRISVSSLECEQDTPQ